MHDAFGVSGIKRVGNFDTQVNQPVNLERTAQYRFPQSLSFQKLQHDEAQATVLPNLVNGADVGMVQSGSGAGFAAKTFERLRVVRDIVGEELQRDEAAQGGVLGAVDNTHPAAAQLVENSIVGDRLPKNRLSIGHGSNMLAEVRSMARELTTAGRSDAPSGFASFTATALTCARARSSTCRLAFRRLKSSGVWPIRACQPW